MDPRDARLTTSQKDQVYSIVVKEGLDPSMFEWTEMIAPEYWHGQSHECVMSVIHQKSSGYYFRFGNEVETMSPGGRLRVEESHRFGGPSYRRDSRMDLVRLWARRVKAEHAAPNLWESLASPNAPSPLDPSDNQPLTKAEQAHIRQRLEALEEQIAQESKLAAEERQYVHERLEYLATAVDRLGKFDWGNVAIGTVVNLVTSGIYDPTRAGALLHQMTGWLANLKFLPA